MASLTNSSLQNLTKQKEEFSESLRKNIRKAKIAIKREITSDPSLCQQVFENSLNWYVMKQRMDDASSLISYAIGTNESIKKTVRTEDDQEQSMGSQRKVEELLVHPNIIKNLGVGQCILVRQQPTRIDLLNVKYINQETIDKNLNFFEDNSLIKKRSEGVLIHLRPKTANPGPLHE
jgi:hypothetical protein